MNPYHKDASSKVRKAFLPWMSSDNEEDDIVALKKALALAKTEGDLAYITTDIEDAAGLIWQFMPQLALIVDRARELGIIEK
ncbi:MAG TPA: hypothetical protein VHC68_00815 [Candidatus Paceibacterota bacterium]|nr:hypothetical protein [Candidatus Paceibacterota bacterium]